MAQTQNIDLALGKPGVFIGMRAACSFAGDNLLLRLGCEPANDSFVSGWPQQESLTRFFEQAVDNMWRADHAKADALKLLRKNYIGTRIMAQDGNQESESLAELELSEPVSHQDALEKLSSKSILICPDTCVLIRMIPDKDPKLSGLAYLDSSKAQMEKCNELLSRDEVGWIAPQQVSREFKDPKDDIANGLRDSLVSGDLGDDLIGDMGYRLEESIKKVESQAKDNRERIIREAVVLDDKKEDVIWEAMDLVNRNEFPNKPGSQQMKDSLILCHLHSFVNFAFDNDRGFSVYFWTFDKFGRKDTQKNRNFPIASRADDERSIGITRDIRKIRPAENS